MQRIKRGSAGIIYFLSKVNGVFISRDVKVVQSSRV